MSSENYLNREDCLSRFEVIQELYPELVSDINLNEMSIDKLHIIYIKLLQIINGLEKERAI